jgi:hypothetical protein
MTNTPMNKIVADLIVSPSDSIVLGLGDETAYLGSVAEGNQIATIGDIATSVGGVDTPFTVEGGTLGTQPTFTGAPLFTGSYVRTGDQVHFQIQVDMDNITSFGSGQYYINLPFPAKHNYQFASGCLHDISTGNDYPIFGHVLAGQSQMVLKSIDAQGNSAFNVPFTATVPVTLNVADNFHVSGDYITDSE